MHRFIDLFIVYKSGLEFFSIQVSKVFRNPDNVHFEVLVHLVNDVISDKDVVTKIMNNSTDLQHIEFKGFAKRHWKNGYYPVAYGWCLGLC